MAKSNAPIWWSMFSAGGVMSAFFVPVLIVITSIAVPTGWVTAEGLRELLQPPVTHIGKLLDILCYGTAVVLTIVAAVKLATL